MAAISPTGWNDGYIYGNIGLTDLTFYAQGLYIDPINADLNLKLRGAENQTYPRLQKTSAKRSEQFWPEKRNMELRSQPVCLLIQEATEHLGP